MNVTAVAIIGIIFGCIYSIVKMVLDYNRHSGKSKHQTSALEQEITELKDRVATLERIVTDEKYQLNKQFESLK